LRISTIAIRKAFTRVALTVMALSWATTSAWGYPLAFTDSAGKEITIEKRPQRVVSLIPGVTETLFKLGAGDALAGITYHSTYPGETAEKTVVGGFFSPSLEKIETVNPDMIFVSSLHDSVAERFASENCIVVRLEGRGMADGFGRIELLGRIFDREKEAGIVLAEITRQLEVIEKKTAKIPPKRRNRVIRLMAHDPLTVPGDDSFQNALIRAAGGIPPRFGRNGNIIGLSLKEWQAFNPQVIYGCGKGRKAALRFLNRPGWKEVDAVRNGKIFYFPCNLTCRASVNTGNFVSWLAARVYAGEFSNKADQVLTQGVFRSESVKLDLGYVKQAQILYETMDDFLNKSFVIDFTEPVSVLSTLEGPRDGIRSVGNHYTPPPCWDMGHDEGLQAKLKRICQTVGRPAENTAFLYTGADMDHLVIREEKFRDMKVLVLATAGVSSNAVRMSRDKGRYYEPGTINIIVLPNMRLSSRAMARAVISATEAKTAALADLDIRSSENPRFYQATGTGTDNIIVAEGRGVSIENAGGHSKMGELIARAVYEAVQEAIARQTGIVADRHVFQRLEERNISVFGLISEDECECGIVKSDLMAPLEGVLMDPRYAAFVKTAMALSDDHESGLITDVSGFEAWGRRTAEEIAGKKIKRMNDLVAYDNMPRVLDAALNALLNGIYYRMLDD